MSIDSISDSSNQASALAQNNQKIAHDLRSPLSALNFLASMNPDLPESSRELLEMAISRFNEIANSLDKNQASDI